jgi:hypothetical protein
MPFSIELLIVHRLLHASGGDFSSDAPRFRYALVECPPCPPNLRGRAVASSAIKTSVPPCTQSCTWKRVAGIIALDVTVGQREAGA